MDGVDALKWTLIGLLVLPSNHGGSVTSRYVVGDLLMLMQMFPRCCD